MAPKPCRPTAGERPPAQHDASEGGPKERIDAREWTWIMGFHATARGMPRAKKPAALLAPSIAITRIQAAHAAARGSVRQPL